MYNDTQQAVQFDGNNEHCATRFGISDELLLGGFTFSFIYKYTGSTSATYQALAGNKSGDFFIGKDNGNTQIGVQDGNYNSNVADGTNAWDGNWHQITYTRSGTAGVVYLDGAQVGSGTWSGADGSDVLIGAESTSFFFTGYMKQVRIYNSAISAGDARKNYEIAKKRYNI